MQSFDAVQTAIVGLMEQSGPSLKRLKEIHAYVNSLPAIDVPIDDLYKQKQAMEQQTFKEENQRLELQNLFK
jgi:hypothetical protein